MEKNKNIIFAVVCVVVLIAILIINNLVNEKNKEILLTGKHYVSIKIKDYGEMKLELDSDTAPITVTNFVNLVEDKFYDGLTFHRIIKGFMAQGGASQDIIVPNITGEFKANGYDNNISHVRGVISMARSDNYNSASSQFFIMHEDEPGLDGNYAAFGKVISGIEVIDKLVKVKVEDNNGTVLEKNQPVIESIRVITKDEANS